MQVALESFRTVGTRSVALFSYMGHDLLLHRVLNGRLGHFGGAVRVLTLTEPITRPLYLRPLQRFVASPRAAGIQNARCDISTS